MAVDLTSPSVGWDRQTGGIITGWQHVLQSLDDLFTTRFGERVMREWYGSLVPQLLGRNMNEVEIVTYFQAICSAIDQFEPRLKVVKVTPLAVDRTGRFDFQMEVHYRPRATYGDFTVEGFRKITTSVDRDGRVSNAGA